jgi:hypothetical protein
MYNNVIKILFTVKYKKDHQKSKNINIHNSHNVTHNNITHNNITHNNITYNNDKHFDDKHFDDKQNDTYNITNGDIKFYSNKCSKLYNYYLFRIIFTEYNSNTNKSDIMYKIYNDHKCLNNKKYGMIAKNISMIVPIKKINVSNNIENQSIILQRKNLDYFNQTVVTIYNPLNKFLIKKKVKTFQLYNTLFIFPWIENIKSKLILLNIYNYTSFYVPDVNITSIIIMFNGINKYEI